MKIAEYLTMFNVTNRERCYLIGFVLFSILGPLVFPGKLHAADDCQIAYRVYKSQKYYQVEIKDGSRVNINKNNVKIVVNGKSGTTVAVQVTNMTLFGPSGTKWVYLKALYASDPPFGFGEYPKNVTLYRVVCNP